MPAHSSILFQDEQNDVLEHLISLKLTHRRPTERRKIILRGNVRQDDRPFQMETWVLVGSLDLLSRLCMCTISAMANSGVARLTIGIETKTAMIRPPT